ncbi:hypothetical protein D3C71_234920 [compost metagenome]
MPWTYSGDPAASDLDRYRFLLSDTIEAEPILQDGEINFILAEYPDHNHRMYELFSKAADLFSREIKKSLGPQSQDPTARLNYFVDRAKHFKSLTTTAGFPSPPCVKPIFGIGMHDNV